MARHLLRDYNTQAFNTSTTTFIGSYLLTMFMRRVLLYTYVGDTNYNINSVGTLLIATADSTPTGAPTFAGGTKAGINLGLNKEFNVSIPSGTRNLTTTGASDVGRILALRSATNSTSNSGCFLITNFDTGTNSYVIDFRSGTSITPDTTILAASNGATLPQATVNAASTAAFPASGTFLIQTNTGISTVTYTAKTATTFTGCTGGTGIMRTGNGIANSTTALPQGTITVTSTSGFPTSGTLFVYTSTGRQTVTYTGITATTFTGCTGGTGVIAFGTVITEVSTTIAAGSNGASLPQSTINVAATDTATTTIASGSNNVYLPIATAGVINVTSTTGFATSGTIYVTTSTGPQIVTYTGTTATTFTGCTGGTGFMSTGNSVRAGFAPSGIAYVTTSAGVQKVNYTGVSGGNQFTGCTGGTGSMSTSGVVYYSPSVPIIEPTDSINWYLYEKDGYAPVQGASNGNTNVQYRGNGTSTTPRIILQSPNALAWQIRICHETPDDSGVGAGGVSNECALITCAPGFGGNGSGDFAVGGTHLHTALFYNANSTIYQGGSIGFGDNVNAAAGTTSIPYRITLAGDDTGIGVSVFGRRPNNATTPNSYWVSFGMCEGEVTPLPPNNEARLYALGSGVSSGNGNSLNDMSWYPANITSGRTQGVSMQSGGGGVRPVPVTAAISLLAYGVGNSQLGSPIFDGSAGDSPWIGGVELFAADVIAGTFQTWVGTTLPPFGFPNFDGRFLGTIPHIREGRANFAEYSATADLVGLHIRRGLWLLWGGPPVVA